MVAVFDGVVPKDILFALRKYFFQYDSSYVFNVYDPAYDEGHDNVNWVAQVPVSTVVLSNENTMNIGCLQCHKITYRHMEHYLPGIE